MHRSPGDVVAQSRAGTDPQQEDPPRRVFGAPVGRGRQADAETDASAAGREGGPAGREPERPPGLVTYAKTGRELLEGLWSPEFPGGELVSAAAALLPKLPVWDGREGPRRRIVIGPGVVAFGSHDPARAARTEERATQRRIRGDHLVQVDTDDDSEGSPGRQIGAWSARSRARMVRRLAELDYSPLFADRDRLPAMLTLTMPGEWLPVAADGATFKGHLKAFRKRFERAWGEPLNCVWKLEFQRRGAPHLHMLMTPPHGLARETSRSSVGAGLPFRKWVSAVWADVVAHPDPEQRRRHELAGTGVDFAEGMRARDPKRLAIYFTKHGVYGAKEYQNKPPAEWLEAGHSVGRYWGYWGLEPLTATVEVSHADLTAASRVTRRWAAAQGRRTQRQVWRTSGKVDPETGEFVGRLRRRTVTRRAKTLRRELGFVVVNDGPGFASELARYLDLRASWEHPHLERTAPISAEPFPGGAGSRVGRSPIGGADAKRP